jgi:hypothetical protein
MNQTKKMSDEQLAQTVDTDNVSYQQASNARQGSSVVSDDNSDQDFTGSRSI